MEFRELTRVNRDQVFRQGWTYPHHIRARLALVCRAWYTVLYNEPRVWTTMFLLDTLMARPEAVSLWIKNSKSMPLVVFIPDRFGLGRDKIFSMLRQEMWWIRCLFWDVFYETDLVALFPLDVSTNAPMLRSLALLRTWSTNNPGACKLGDIHCSELRTLFLWINGEMNSLSVRSLKNVHHLSIIHQDYRDDNGILQYLTQAS